MRKARAATHELRALTPNGPVVMMLCLLVGLTPLIFAATLFEPYIAAKEIVLQAGAATVLLSWLLSDRLRTWVVTPLWLPLVALSVIGILSLAWSSQPAASFQEARRLVPYVLLFIVTMHIMRDSGARSALTTAVVLAGTVEAAYILLQFSVGDPLFFTEGLQGKWRTFGTFGNPNWAGEFLAVAALVALGGALGISQKAATGAWKRHAWLAAFIVIFLGLIATLARGAWIGFAAALLCFVLLLRRHGDGHRSGWKSAIIPVCITAAAGVGLIVSVVVRSETLEFLVNTRSVRGRFWISAVTVDMIRDAPFLGHGLGTFPLEFPFYQAEAFTRPWSTDFLTNASFTSFAHNDFLQLWAELGMVGLAAFAGVIWLAIRRGQAAASDPMALGCWSGLIAILVNALFAFPLHLPTSLMLFAVLLGVVEGVAAGRTSSIGSSVQRAGIAIPLIFACILAYDASYQRLITESELWRAETALQNGDRREAERSALAAIEHTPARSEGYAILGRVHFENGADQEAIDLFDKAIRRGFDADVFEKKAVALERTGRVSEAVAVMNELVRLRPDLGSARQHLNALNDRAERPQEEQP